MWEEATSRVKGVTVQFPKEEQARQNSTLKTGNAVPGSFCLAYCDQCRIPMSEFEKDQYLEAGLGEREGRSERSCSKSYLV